ncbi:hypothetical protein QP178_05370 [Sphingomonas aurantiaca]|uniref:hypothetical protein n=1 Tax=Sphingomonas aurantiaca TaxID=185949 RepID=UPI002FE1B853
MLDEYILVPDVFDPEAYSKPDYADMCLASLKLPLLEEALVRDLRDGGWGAFCTAHAGTLHRLTKELLKKLRSTNRLRPHPALLAEQPEDAAGWLAEGIASHAAEPVRGIIAAHACIDPERSGTEPLVSIEKLTGANWWQSRGPSRTVSRSLADYGSALLPILRQANSVMIVDPYLDPSLPNYRDFGLLLEPLAARPRPPIVELHRCFYYRSGGEIVVPSPDDWRARFAALDGFLDARGLAADVFFWNYDHDRFLISDVFGLSASAGFDVTSDPNAKAIWGRLSAADKDRVQRDFDPAASTGTYKFRIRIGRS